MGTRYPAGGGGGGVGRGPIHDPLRSMGGGRFGEGPIHDPDPKVPRSGSKSAPSNL